MTAVTASLFQTHGGTDCNYISQDNYFFEDEKGTIICWTITNNSLGIF